MKNSLQLALFAGACAALALIFIGCGGEQGSAEAAENYHVLGAKDAPVVIEEFSDFQCPFCRRHALTTFSQIKADLIDKGLVRYVFHDLPLTNIHPEAYKAHLAAHCAGEQGKFWEYGHKLFENQQALQPEKLAEYAGELGLDVATWQNCLREERYKSKVDENINLAKERGVTGTPAFFINGEQISGAQPYQVFLNVIQKHLSQEQKKLLGELAKEDPVVEMIVLNDKRCDYCDPNPVIEGAKQQAFPTLRARIVDISSAEGKELIKRFDVKALPAYFLTPAVEKTRNFGMASDSLIKKGDLYMIDPGRVDSQKTLEPPSPEGYPSLGKKDAPVTIIEFADFQCGFCARFHRDTFPEIKKNYIDKGLVRFVYRPFPLGFKHSQISAIAGYCAADQGKFWEYHDSLFGKMANFEREDLLTIARQVNLNAQKFEACLKSNKHLPAIEKSAKEGAKVGVNSTPTFFINNARLTGAQPYERFQMVIERELKR